MCIDYTIKVSFDWVLDLVFPKFCLGCSRLGDYICSQCEQKIDFYDPQTCPYCELPSPYGLVHPRCQKSQGIDGMFVLAHYQGLIKQIIHQVKYDGQFTLLEDVTRLMAAKYHGKYAFDYFVPIPLFKKREQERGFNQAEKLASQLSVMLACPASLNIRDSGVTRLGWVPQNDSIKVVDLLTRVRQTRPQFDLKYNDRKLNVRDAFSLSPLLLSNSLTNYSFCLIDDVATTGATIFECAKILKRKGADFVWAMTICRGG